MENVRELTRGGTVARVVFREISHSGAGFVALRGDGEHRDLLLSMGVSELYEAGAKPIFCGFLTDGRMRIPRTCGFEAFGQFYSFVHEVDALSIDLKTLPERGTDGFAFGFVRLDGENAPLYCSIYNEAFAKTPNFATCADDSIASLLSGSDVTAQLVYLNGEPAGVLETSLDEGQPVIDGIALLPGMRGRGAGRALLRRVLGQCRREGYEKTSLLVSTANPLAYGLYVSEGFVRQRMHARWFRLETGEE